MKYKLLSACIILALFFYSCSKNNPVNSNNSSSNSSQIIFKDNAKILSDYEAAKITSISDSTIIFSPVDDTLNALKVGDIIIAGITSNTPNGLLKEITAITDGSSSSKIFTTQNASLENFIKSGEISFDSKVFSIKQTINQLLYDMDDNPSTLNDQVSLTGTVNETGELSGNLTIGKTYSVSGQFNFKFAGNTDLNLDGNINTNLNVVQYFFRSPFQPILIHDNPPIVVTPVISLYAVLQGNAQGKFTTGVSNNFQSTVGISLGTSLQFQPGLGDTFVFKDASINFSSNLKLKLITSVSFLINGIQGPSLSFAPYMQLSSNLDQTPKWILYVGDNGTAGLNASWFSNSVPAKTWNFSTNSNELSQSQ